MYKSFPFLDIKETLSCIWIIITCPPFLCVSDKEEKRIRNTIRKIDQNKSSRKQDSDRKRKRDTIWETYKYIKLCSERTIEVKIIYNGRPAVVVTRYITIYVQTYCTSYVFKNVSIAIFQEII